MDVFLQRLSRLHRHRQRDDHRPAGHKQAQCIVLTTPVPMANLLAPGATRGLGLGSKSAYPDLLCLHATLLQLGSADAHPRVLTIQRDNRALVESACSAAALNALAEPEGSAWQKRRSELLGKAGAQAGAALYSLVDWSKPWHEAVAGELSTEARTRLGLDGIDLDLPSRPMGPFGRLVPGITVPAWMLGELARQTGAAQTAPLVDD